jgi:2-deoxy-D-gluconate 3-dehydrogenase
LDLRLKDSVAIVTGASRGLGRAAALALVEEGGRVLATARSRGELEALSAAHPDKIVPLVCDMRDLDAVFNLASQAIQAFGRLDIVVNNAGIAPAGAFVDATVQGLNEILTVNVIAPAVLTRAAGMQMIAQKRGKIINIASISGLRGKATLVGYSASKGALVQFTKALSAEWARHNIQVNSIAPGGFITEAQAAVLNDPEVLRKRVKKIPAGRMADASEIGALICYLASPLSDFVTGAIYAIDGGETAKI